MEAGAQSQPHVDAPETIRGKVPVWALGAIPLVLIVAALAALLTVGGDTLGERLGPPVEEIAVERTVLRPGEIELTVRNTGPDAVTVAQMFVNDQYVDYETSGNQIGRNGTEMFTLDYPWQPDSPYLVTLVSETGATTEHEIPVAVQTPSADGGFYGLMALLGLYVGVIPVALGMLFLPFLRRVREHWIRFFMALTIGLLGFLAVDAYLEGTEIAESGTGAFGGAMLLFIGAAAAYLGLVALDRWLRARGERARETGASAFQLSLLVAIGIGLHNLGEGLAIGSAYAVGELALGAFLVFGFALHNTTEGLAIVAPLSSHRRPSLGRLAMLGLIAGAPAIVGAFIGASAFNPELAALLIGVGIGAIVQVIVQLVPAIRDRAGRALYPASVGGILAGVAVLYLTGLLVSA
ncbi:MAG: ZIP family metal transporter [Chloroflexota bacterium]|nr:ZIP family metal transporter [Chloroflexota bacterium]